MRLPSTKCLPILLGMFASSAHGQGLPTEPTAPDVVLFPGPMMTRAARLPEPKVPLYFRDFPEEDFVARDFAIVGREVLEKVEGLFEGHLPNPPRPILCVVTKGQFGRTVRLNFKDSEYIGILIALNNDDLKQRNYCRFVYQFSHELGHYFLDPSRSNGLIESIADALQYRVLHEMPELWKNQYADNSNLLAYADRYPAYWRAKADKRLTALPEEDRHPRTVAHFLKARLHQLDGNHNGPTALGLRMIAASAFPADAPWSEFVGIAARTDPSPAIENHFREDLPTDLSEASSAMKKALLSIGRE